MKLTLIQQHKDYKGQWVISGFNTDNRLVWLVLYDDGSNTPVRFSRSGAYRAYDKRLKAN